MAEREREEIALEISRSLWGAQCMCLVLARTAEFFGESPDDLEALGNEVYQTGVSEIIALVASRLKKAISLLEALE